MMARAPEASDGWSRQRGWLVAVESFQMTWIIAALLIVGIPGAARAETQWFLNGNGTDNTYRIWQFADDGLPLTTPVVLPPPGYRHVAWPSAVRIGDARHVYASVYDGKKWGEIHLWQDDGKGFDHRGARFVADPVAEPHGVGPAQLVYEPAEPEPYALYYLVRGAAGPGQAIALATSKDGATWTRRGNVITATLPEEASGLTMSYACRASDGDFVLAYSGYFEGAAKAAALAVKGPREGPFTDKTVIARPDGFQATVTTGPAENFGLFPDRVSVPIGMPLLIVDGDYNETVVPIKQVGRTVFFDRPTFFAHPSASVFSMAASKIDPSFIEETPDGWRGIFTVYGPAPGSFAEYTTEFSAPSPTGQWTPDGAGLRFTPWQNETLRSTENPTPLVRDASCSRAP